MKFVIEANDNKVVVNGVVHDFGTKENTIPLDEKVMIALADTLGFEPAETLNFDCFDISAYTTKYQVWALGYTDNYESMTDFEKMFFESDYYSDALNYFSDKENAKRIKKDLYNRPPQKDGTVLYSIVLEEVIFDETGKEVNCEELDSYTIA